VTGRDPRGTPDGSVVGVGGQECRRTVGIHQQGAAGQPFRQSVVGEVLQELADAGTGGADHRGEFVMGDPGLDVLPSVVPDAEPVGQLQKNGGEPVPGRGAGAGVVTQPIVVMQNG
jgi:hypothetical protein